MTTMSTTATASTQLETEYLVTLHTPMSSVPPHAIDDGLTIYHAGEGGWAKGPKLAGAIIQPTADWLLALPNGSLRVDARMTIRTDDDALIHAAYGGVISVTRENLERMAGGGLLTAQDMYFMIAPTFRTAHPRYAWLNHIQAIGKVVGVKGGDQGFVTYDVFAVR